MPEATPPVTAPTPTVEQQAPTTESPAKAKPKPAQQSAPEPSTQMDFDSDVDARAAQLMEDIKAGKFSEPGEEAAETAAPAEDEDFEEYNPEIASTAPAEEEEKKKPKEAIAPPPPEEGDEDPAEKARLETLEKEAAAEREKRKREADFVARENRFKADLARFQQDVQTVQQQVNEAWQRIQQKEAEAEQRLKVLDDPAELYALLAERVPPDQLARLIDEGMSPAKQAEWATKRAQKLARKEIDPEIASLRETVTELTRHIKEQQAREAYHAKQQGFAAHTTSIASEVPLAAKLLQKNPQRYFAMADAAANDLVRQFGSTDFDSIAKHIEEELQSFQLAEVTQPGQQAATPRTEPVATQAQVTRARTLTNRTAAGRSIPTSDDGHVYATLDAQADAIKAAIRAGTLKT